MGSFSFLSNSDRRMIDETDRLAGSTQRAVEEMISAPLTDFPAQLTAYDATSGFYTWQRRAFDADAVRYDYPTTVQSGSPISNPARFPNGDVVDVSTPVDVWLRPVGISTAVGMVHEVIAGPAASSTSGGFIPDVSGVLTVALPVGTTTVKDYQFTRNGYYLVSPNIQIVIVGGPPSASWGGYSNVTFISGSGTFLRGCDRLQDLTGTVAGAVSGIAQFQIGPPFLVLVQSAPATMRIFVVMASQVNSFVTLQGPFGGSSFGNWINVIPLLYLP